MSPARRASVLFGCLLLAACGAPAAFAQFEGAPMPPPRPADLPPSPAPQSPAQAPPPVDVLPPIDPDHPPMLPTASRARMRACGREWEAMKMAGKDEIGWRAFATQCLTRPGA